jgi:hypothetical protein
VVTDRVDLPEQVIGAVAGCGESLAGLSKFLQMVGLNFEQAGFRGGGAAQPP